MLAKTIRLLLHHFVTVDGVRHLITKIVYTQLNVQRIK